jgi:hypothetical protein
VRQCKGCGDNNCKECHGTEQVNRCATQNQVQHHPKSSATPNPKSNATPKIKCNTDFSRSC